MMMKSARIWQSIAYTLALVLWGTIPIAPAKSGNPPTAPHSLLAWEFVPPNDGAPEENLDDAASRQGFCPESEKSFQALIPATNLGWTTAEYPTFLLYVPYPFPDSEQIEFVLRDENTKAEIYRTTLTLETGTGLIRFQLPEDAPPLEIGRKYRWRFFGYCNGQDSPDYLTDTGVVLRVALDAQVGDLLAAASPTERVDLYAENGVWHEALMELAQLRSSNPEDEALLGLWSNLLQHPAVGLDDFVSEPLLNE